jgi:cysteine-rich repeat protein
VEQCDDGNTTDQDGCSAACQLESVCGNGVQEGAEQCDDGNTADQDGCSATCQLESLVDHYKCYSAKTAPKTPKFESREVTLTDQFESKQTIVKPPVALCNPVDKNEEGIQDPTAHLVCHDIAQVKRQAKFVKHQVQVQDQFCALTLSVTAPDTLCVPSEKDGVASALKLDHFKCYAAKIAPKTPKFASRDVTLTDQYETKVVTVLKPVGVCAPVQKNEEPIRDAQTHLTCYQMKDVKGQEKFAKRLAQVRNQFGELTLNVTKANTLCVPAAKTDLGPAGLESDTDE